MLRGRRFIESYTYGQRRALGSENRGDTDVSSSDEGATNTVCAAFTFELVSLCVCWRVADIFDDVSICPSLSGSLLGKKSQSLFLF